MDQKLFTDFDPISSKQWKNLIQYELKGADFNQTVVWESLEGIKVKPLYHSDEDQQNIQINTEASQFKIVQDIFVFDLEKSIHKANGSIKRGAESLKFTIASAAVDCEKLLKGITAVGIQVVYLNLQFLNASYLLQIDNLAATLPFKVYMLTDIVGQLGREGNWYSSQQSDLEILKQVQPQLKNCSLISVDSTLYQNAGANSVQQIAFTLAHANEYFNALPQLNREMVIQVAQGSNYFFEIAKLRAIRWCFDSLMAAYDFDVKIHILAMPTKRNKTLYDYNNNMLRTTTECMSAILGGADAVCNLPYDAIYHKTNEFGDRISRNQLLILKKESYFDKVDNPADGAYYIEYITEQLAEKAMELFKDIESHGGLIDGLIDGAIQRKINQSAAKEQDLFDTGKEILLGTNKHPNPADKMKDALELYPFVKKMSGKKAITPIVEKRLAEKVEQERLELEAAQANTPS